MRLNVGQINGLDRNHVVGCTDARIKGKVLLALVEFDATDGARENLG